MIREPFAGGGAERLDEVQVIMRRYRRAVAQIGRQQRQFGLDIGTRSIPAQQGIDSEAVTKIVNPWQLPFRCDDTALLEQWLQTELQTGAAIGSSTPGGIPDKSCIRRNREPPVLRARR